MNKTKKSICCNEDIIVNNNKKEICSACFRIVDNNDKFIVFIGDTDFTKNAICNNSNGIFSPEVSSIQRIIQSEKDEVLEVLEKCINTYIDRREQYGDWIDNINNAITEAKKEYGKDLTMDQYLIVMQTWKVARQKKLNKEDSLVDEIIYKIMYYLTKNNE